MVLGSLRKKSVVSFRKLGMCLVRGFSKMSKRLLIVLVKQEGPTIIGRNFKSWIPGILTSDVLDCSCAILIEMLL